MTGEQIKDRLDQIAVIVTDLFIQSKRNDHRLKDIETDVRTLRREIAADSGRLSDVFGKTLRLYNQLVEIEARSAPFKKYEFEIKRDARKVYDELMVLWKDLQDTAEVRSKLDEFAVRVETIEDRLAA